jgi:hypothetical protein
MIAAPQAVVEQLQALEQLVAETPSVEIQWAYSLLYFL